MNAWTMPLQATALCLSLLWLLLALAERPRSPLNVVWGLFCGSMAMAMARSLVGADAGLWHQALGLGACLTCNGFWLVARALFREGRPFGPPHVAYAGIVAALIIATQQEAAAPDALIVVTGELLQLLSSVVLVLAFWEGLRGWRQYRGVERTLRILFMATYGGCVMTCFVAPPLLDPTATGGASATASAVAATAILLVAQGLVAWRLRHPLWSGDETTGADDATQTAPAVRTSPAKADRAQAPAARTEDAALARSLEHHMRTQRPYLQPDLTLAHLAQALEVGEYRISRAVHGPLGQRNVSHYVNRYRVDHARALLIDPACDHWSTLVVGLESGFGSLGAFHRVFRTAEGCTPGEYRRRAG